mgnify:CR=1 FL=1
MSIREIIEKCKARDVYTALIFVVVGFGSFGLGRLSVLMETKTPIVIQNNNEALVGLGEDSFNTGEEPQFNSGSQTQTPSVPVSEGLLIASKSGKKYHFPWCSGAQRISEVNKIWFASYEEARSAGYAPASNCKGLK